MFHIHSISAGWMQGQISDGEKTHYFDYSYITNFLDDFILHDSLSFFRKNLSFL